MKNGGLPAKGDAHAKSSVGTSDEPHELNSYPIPRELEQLDQHCFALANRKRPSTDFRSDTIPHEREDVLIQNALRLLVITNTKPAINNRESDRNWATDDIDRQIRNHRSLNCAPRQGDGH